MNNGTFWIYLLIMAGVTYLIRVVPLIACRGEFKNRFVKSMLYYIPYTVLASMTFPAVFFATQSYVCSAVGVMVALLVAYKGGSLLKVAIAACVTVLICNMILL